MKEISAFIVEKGTQDSHSEQKEKKMGIRGSATYELIFEDCRIPAENLLGKKGKGFNIAMHTLDGGRIGIAAQALGLAEGALETTIEYVKERKQFGRSIGQFQNTQFQLADMATKVEAAKMLVYKAAMAKATQKTYFLKLHRLNYAQQKLQWKLQLRLFSYMVVMVISENMTLKE